MIQYKKKGITLKTLIHIFEINPATDEEVHVEVKESIDPASGAQFFDLLGQEGDLEYEEEELVEVLEEVINTHKGKGFTTITLEEEEVNIRYELE